MHLLFQSTHFFKKLARVVFGPDPVHRTRQNPVVGGPSPPGPASRGGEARPMSLGWYQNER